MEKEENYSKGSPPLSKGSPNYKSDLEFWDRTSSPSSLRWLRTKPSFREK